MTDRLKGIEVFVRAIRLGGLSAAARAMNMSPAMAARHVDVLEARLGTTLINRTTRRLGLTDAGVAYLERAERILAEVEEADVEASAQSRIVEGRLRVSVAATFGVMYVAEMAAEFHRLHPNVTVELGLNDRVVDLLEERWDMAIRIGQLSDSTLVARKVANSRFTICASPDYLERRGTPRILADLANHDCLGYTLSAAFGPDYWAFGRNGRKKVPVKGSLHANSGEALVRAAEAGLGLVYGPRYIAAPAITAGRLAELELDEPMIDHGGIYAVTPKRHTAAKTRAWIDFLAGRFSQMTIEL